MSIQTPWRKDIKIRFGFVFIIIYHCIIFSVKSHNFGCGIFFPRKTMEPMATSKKVLTWIYLYPVNENTDDTKKKRKVQRNFLLSIFAFLSSGLSFSIACLFKYWSIDLKKSLYSPIQIGPTLSTVYSLFIALMLRNRIRTMFNNLSKIYEKSKTNFLFHFPCDNWIPVVNL